MMTDILIRIKLRSSLSCQHHLASLWPQRFFLYYDALSYITCYNDSPPYTLRMCKTSDDLGHQIDENCHDSKNW